MTPTKNWEKMDFVIIKPILLLKKICHFFRFKAVIEMVRPDKMDPAVNIKGVDYVEVPPNSSRKYKLSFFSYKEGQTQIKVVFKNEASGEYQVGISFSFLGVLALTLLNVLLSKLVRRNDVYS